MKKVVCNRSIGELMMEKWGEQKIGLYYCAKKNNKIYIPFGKFIEIYDESEYTKIYGNEMSNKNTNYERIKAMSIEEMAKFMTEKTLEKKVHNLSENNQITATYMADIGKSLYRQYFVWLESEVDT